MFGGVAMNVRRVICCLLMLTLAACNLGVPEVTPTLAPTRTPSPSPEASNTPEPTLIAQAATGTPSFTPSPTPTLTPTNTLSPTPSGTPSFTPTLTMTNTDEPTATSTFTPTDTPTATATFTPTNTNEPSATPTDTPTITPTPTLTNTPQPTETDTPVPTVTPLPLIPTDTPPPTATATETIPPTLTSLPTLTLTPSRTPAPTLTPTRTLSAGELQAFQTAQAATLAPPTLPPAPTLDVTPTFITAEAEVTNVAEVSPIPADTTPEGIAPTATPQPTVALIVTLAPVVTAGPPVLPPVVIQPVNPPSRAFALGGPTGGTGFGLVNDVTLFARNPVRPDEYVSTDSSGNLYITGVNGAGGYRPDMSPFSQFVALSRDGNDAFVSAVNWSPDGRYLAFIINSDKVAKDGVWFFEPGQFPPIQLLYDCPTPGFVGCSLTDPAFNPDLWESRELRWSPNSDAVLVGLALPAEGRGAISILPTSFDPRAGSIRQPVFRWDFGTWARDGGRVLVSGRGEDGHVLVGWLNRDGTFSELVYDAEANGLWMGYANQARSGAVYALGAPGDRGGAREPLRIYDMGGRALTGIIGDGAIPERVEWSPAGDQVFVQVNGRQYIADINGGVNDISGQVAGARAVNWVEGALPPSAETTSPGIVPVGATAEQVIVPVGATAAPSIPIGVVEGSQYQPGQQLRVYSTELNIRSGPGVAYDFARNFLQTGEYVAILAGPVNADGVIWWQVQTADGIVGWIAGEIDGLSTLGP